MLFTGENPSWTQYGSDLTSFKDSNVKIRFRFGSDYSINLRGWFLDDINISWMQACTTLPIAPGAVPDNYHYAGIPLLVSKSGMNLLLNWGAPLGSCETADYAIYRGTIPFVGYDHAPVLCTTGGTANAVIPSDSGSYYFLVTAQNNGEEGSYGLDSAGSQRPPALSPCFPLNIGSCN
jgi:hypothetical protein